MLFTLPPCAAASLKNWTWPLCKRSKQPDTSTFGLGVAIARLHEDYQFY
jgi:hypothetical protein